MRPPAGVTSEGNHLTPFLYILQGVRPSVRPYVPSSIRLVLSEIKFWVSYDAVVAPHRPVRNPDLLLLQRRPRALRVLRHVRLLRRYKALSLRQHPILAHQAPPTPSILVSLVITERIPTVPCRHRVAPTQLALGISKRRSIRRGRAHRRQHAFIHTTSFLSPIIRAPSSGHS